MVAKKVGVKKSTRKKAKGKGKGQQFERDICRKLSLWVSGGKSKNLFWRSSQSGGRATTLRKIGECLSVHAGDIAAIDPQGVPFINQFFIECKRLKSMDLGLLFYRHLQGRLGPIWKKCCKQAGQYNKTPLLIFKENGKPEMICFPLRFTDIELDGLVEKRWVIPIPVLNYQNSDAVICALSDFLILKPKNLLMEKNDAGHHHGGFSSNWKKRRRLSL